MELLSSRVSQLLNPQEVIQYGGLALVVFFVFAETGLLIGLFLPGDSLLFTAGLLAGTHVLGLSAFTLFISVFSASILGDSVGYRFGKSTGKHLFHKKDTRYFKQVYLHRAKEFYDRYGGMAISLGKFFPIFRTLIPILAGIVEVPYKKFFKYSFAGSFVRVGGFCLSGFYLGREFPWVQDYLEYVILAILLISTLPVIYKMFIKKFTHKKKDFEKHPEEYFVP